MAPFRSIRHKNWQTCRMMRERDEGDDDADGGAVCRKRSSVIGSKNRKQSFTRKEGEYGIGVKNQFRMKFLNKNKTIVDFY